MIPDRESANSKASERDYKPGQGREGRKVELAAITAKRLEHMVRQARRDLLTLPQTPDEEFPAVKRIGWRTQTTRARRR
jgi:hypothetical protein